MHALKHSLKKDYHGYLIYLNVNEDIAEGVFIYDESNFLYVTATDGTSDEETLLIKDSDDEEMYGKDMWLQRMQ